jgi:hypothetical protein
MNKLTWIILAVIVIWSGEQLSDNKDAQAKREAECAAQGGTLRGNTCVNFSKTK